MPGSVSFACLLGFFELIACRVGEYTVHREYSEPRLSEINTTYLLTCVANMTTRSLDISIVHVPRHNAEQLPLDPLRMRGADMTDVRLVDKTKGECRPKIDEERPKWGSTFEIP